MSDVNFKKVVTGSVDGIVARVGEALKAEGFGILTRIDFHEKMKEKLGQKLPPTVILGACNPQMAFEAFRRNSNVASLIPCNVVVREIEGENGKVSVEIAKPTAMLQVLGDRELSEMAKVADEQLSRALNKI